MDQARRSWSDPGCCVLLVPRPGGVFPYDFVERVHAHVVCGLRARVEGPRPVDLAIHVRSVPIDADGVPTTAAAVGHCPHCTNCGAVPTRLGYMLSKGICRVLLRAGA